MIVGLRLRLTRPSVIPVLLLSFLFSFCHSCESRNPESLPCERRKKQRPWILYLTGSPIRSGTSVEDDRKRQRKSKDPGSSITNVEDDRRKEHRLLCGMIVGLRLRLTRPSVIPVLLLSFLFSFCHSCESRNPESLPCERRKKQKPWILYLTGSPIRSGTSVEDDRKRQRKSKDPGSS